MRIKCATRAIPIFCDVLIEKRKSRGLFLTTLRYFLEFIFGFQIKTDKDSI